MSLVVRTPKNDNSGSYAAQPTFGWFDITIPGGYTPGDGITITVNAQLALDSGGFSGATAQLVVGAVLLGGGPITSAALSSSNLTWVGGSQVANYADAPEQTVTAGASNLTFAISGDNVSAPDPSSGGYVLGNQSAMTGAPWFISTGVANDGYFLDSPGGAAEAAYTVIKGDGYPFPPVTTLFGAGHDVGAVFGALAAGSVQYDVGDVLSIVLLASTFSGSAAFIAIQINSITVTINGVPSVLDLTTIRKGFGPGSGSYYADSPISTVDARNLHSFYKADYVPPAPGFRPFSIDATLIPARIGRMPGL